MNKYQAWQAFWSSFGWAAYNENTVPDNAMELNNNRYITYESCSDSFGNVNLVTVSLFHRSTSWTTIHAKAEEIAERIKRMYPPSIEIDGGRMKISTGQPFASDMSDEDDTIRRVRLNVLVEFMTAY